MTKLLAGSLLVASAALFSGCGDSVPSNANALYKENNRDTNFLGLVTNSPASYAEVPATTLALRAGDASVHRNISGDNTTLLWGLLTFADY